MPGAINGLHRLNRDFAAKFLRRQRVHPNFDIGLAFCL